MQKNMSIPSFYQKNNLQKSHSLVQTSQIEEAEVCEDHVDLVDWNSQSAVQPLREHRAPVNKL